MLPSRQMLIETDRVNWKSLPGLLAFLQGCWKSSSLLWMQSNEFPVLPGLIVCGWGVETQEAVSQFASERCFSELLVRVEKPGQRWTRRRGGYTIPVQDVHDLVDELAREDMLTILLEPLSPYADVYGLAAVCDIPTGIVDVEVVGPGFDASDILRSDDTPHERFEALLGQCQELSIRRSHLVEPEAYRASVHRRLTKIGARLRNPSFPDEVLHATSGTLSEQLAQDALEYLQKTGHKLLLNHLINYQPIPRELLEAFLRQLSRLFHAAGKTQFPWQVLSVAGSFLARDRLVIWDFFAPGSYDTTVLSTISAGSFPE